MKLNKTLTLIFIAVINLAFAQYEVPPGYYMFPIRPGDVNFISGSMGELRSTHFHGGLDIKTSGITGLKVFAAADGYVSRIKITLGGYGNALYIKHLNGTTTVYAHLKEFSEPIQKFVLEQQYKNESFTVDLYPGKHEFPVKKGDVIALSGNSGSSRGPHLHFEIRDKNHHVMDPQRFLFQELKDNISPVLDKVAFVSKSPTAKINGMVGRFEFDVKNVGGNYIIQEPVHLSGRIGVEIYAWDKANGTRNRYGIPDLVLKVNGQPIFQQEIRKIPYPKMRDILVHTNYQVQASGGKRFNKLYVDDGNSLDFYSTTNNGYFNFKDSTRYTISIEMMDPCGNVSWFKTSVNDKPAKIKPGQENNWRLHENTVVVTVRDTSRTLDFYANNLKYTLTPDYIQRGNSTFVWDLRNGLIDSVDLCDHMAVPNFVQTVYPNQETSFYNHTVNVYFPGNALFDTLYLRYQYKFDSSSSREHFVFENGIDPLRRNVQVTLKPRLSNNTTYDRVYAVGNKGLSFVGGEWSPNNEISFRTRDLIEYTIATDSVPPVITPKKMTQEQIRIHIDDELSGVKSYRAELNGKWLLLKLDAKYGLLTSEKNDPNIPFKGEFILEVEDNTGNLKYFQNKIE